MLYLLKIGLKEAKFWGTLQYIPYNIYIYHIVLQTDSADIKWKIIRLRPCSFVSPEGPDACANKTSINQ